MYEGNKDFWSGKKILLTGGGGFLGQHIKIALKNYDCQIIAPDKEGCDFMNAEQTEAVLLKGKPEIVIHAAVDYRGLKAQMDAPVEILYNNLAMDSNLFKQSYKAGVKKFVGFGSYLAYPAALRAPFEEYQYLNGELCDCSAVYGMVKRVLYLNGWAYKKEYNFDSIHLILPNLFGKNQGVNNVVAALINKFKQAESNNENSVRVWGDGSSVRDFLYIDDAVKLILLATERYNDIQPLNIGTGMATSIKGLVDVISRAYSFRGDIIWEKDKPNGIPFRALKIDKMKKILACMPQVSLEEGIKMII